MRLLPGLALLGVLCLSRPVSAQSYDYDAQAGTFAQDPEALVRFWYQKYLSRPADPLGLAGWTQLVAQGTPPANVLGAILSCQEYFDRAGDTPQGFARTLFLDVTGREPTPREYNWVLSRLAYGAGPVERGNIAYDLLTRYPQALYPPFAPGPVAGPPWGRQHEYRRPDWRYRP